MSPLSEPFTALLDRLDKLETRFDITQAAVEKIRALMEDSHQGSVREWYSVAEVAKRLGKAEFTVRQWCRQGRVNAGKQQRAGRWVISHVELERYRRDGLLPLREAAGHDLLRN